VCWFFFSRKDIIFRDYYVAKIACEAFWVRFCRKYGFFFLFEAISAMWNGLERTEDLELRLEQSLVDVPQENYLSFLVYIGMSDKNRSISRRRVVVAASSRWELAGTNRVCCI
jgi:hypothetical protein